MTTATADAATSLRELLANRTSREAIQSYMDGLSSSARVEQALSLGGKQVAKLYHACADGPQLTLEDFVPPNLSDDETVIFHGRNSLPAFRSFQKRFARMNGKIVGYNHQTMAFATGPGFFIVKAAHEGSDIPDELYFDYTDAPTKAEIPSGWPAFKPNDSGLSNLVYKNMKDYMRSVAKNIVVGTAYKLGKPQNQYFLLACDE